MTEPVAPVQDSFALPQRFGRYRILCELGTGSMATLYLARMTGLGRFERLFAIKVTHDHLTKEPGFVEMFMNEARIAAKIQHPNVIPVYEIEVERGRYYMVMDYVSGETLALVLKHSWNRDRPFPAAFAAQIIYSACEGLHAAHELRNSEGPMGVVHRDVAPQNLMIGYDGIVRVMDFGIAKALDTVSLTKPGMMKGTVAYMAPEQVRCQEIDRRVDVFALGAILWESTVGMRLFRHKNDVTTAARVVKMNVPAPSTVRAGYPPELERIVMTALAREKGQRYETAREMGEDLAEFLHRAQEKVTPEAIADFMGEIFPEQRRERLRMEQVARELDPPADLRYTPADSSTDSLSAVNADEEVDIADLAPTSQTFAIMPIEIQRSQKGTPTMIVRVRKSSALSEEPAPKSKKRRIVAAASAAVLVTIGALWLAGEEPEPIAASPPPKPVQMQQVFVPPPVPPPPVVVEEPVVEPEKPKPIPRKKRSKPPEKKAPALLFKGDDL